MSREKYHNCDRYSPSAASIPRRPLVGTPHDVGVLERPFSQMLQCFCLAQRDKWGGRRRDRGPELCRVTSKTPATTRLILSHTQHNSRRYPQAISRSGKGVMCRGRHQKARYAPWSVLTREREGAGDVKIMLHVRGSIRSTNC